MAESTTTPMEDTTQTQSADGSGGAGERTFTQEQVNRMIQERLARAKSEPPADYEDLKAKAAKYDQLEEANKSELERFSDAATKAKAEANNWKAKYEAIQAEQIRLHEIQAKAKEYGVDAGTLTRMSGDVEENAKYLAGLEAARPKFPTVHDGGEQQVAGPSLEEALKGAKSVNDRIRIRAEFNARKNR